MSENAARNHGRRDTHQRQDGDLLAAEDEQNERHEGDDGVEWIDMEIFILLLLRKLLEISGAAFLVWPFAADDCNRGERDGADNGCSDGGRCLIHNDRHDVCARKIRDEGVM